MHTAGSYAHTTHLIDRIIIRIHYIKAEDTNKICVCILRFYEIHLTDKLTSLTFINFYLY